ncbi:unnamed protein product [Caenorhabditis sp. 36 PRJEB53466]|nr:unnamed protein product [Caenorhabditis sp. 36 PRJEB53466]
MREFLYRFRFIADFASIGILCLMSIFTMVVIYLTHNIIDEIDEVRDVFMRKKQDFEMYANDAENLMAHNRHLDGFSDIFGTLIRINMSSTSASTSEIIFKVESSDGVRLHITEKALAQSNTLSNLIQGLELTPESAAEMGPIPLRNVDGETMKVVIEWSENNKNAAPFTPEDEENSPSVRSSFDDRLFLDKLDHQQLVKVIAAANFLETKRLLYVACKHAADIISEYQLRQNN